MGVRQRFRGGIERRPCLHEPPVRPLDTAPERLGGLQVLAGGNDFVEPSAQPFEPGREFRRLTAAHARRQPADRVGEGDERWQTLPTPEGDQFTWDIGSTYVRRPTFFDDLTPEPKPVQDIAKLLYFLTGASTERQAVLAYNQINTGLRDLGETAISETIITPIKQQEPGHFAFYQMSATAMIQDKMLKPWQLFMTRVLREKSYNLVGTNAMERDKADMGQVVVDLGLDVVLVRAETSPEDFHGMVAAKAILTARGGLVSHAAVVARGWGIPAVVGADGG